jgi:hypothetical protein
MPVFMKEWAMARKLQLAAIGSVWRTLGVVLYVLATEQSRFR